MQPQSPVFINPLYHAGATHLPNTTSSPRASSSTVAPILPQDTLVSMSPERSPRHPGLKPPRKATLLLRLGSASIGLVAGYGLATLRKLELVSKLALGLGGGIIFYALSLLPTIFSRFKLANERFWAAIDLSNWGLTIVQKVISLASFLPKIAGSASRVLAFSMTNSVLSLVTFTLSAITSARALLAFYEIKHLHQLGTITAHNLSDFISERSRMRWVIEEFATHQTENVNRFIHNEPEKAAAWLKKITKAALVFSSINALSQILGASAVIVGLVGGGIVGVPLLMVSTGLFLLNMLAQHIATRIWLKELPKVA